MNIAFGPIDTFKKSYPLLVDGEIRNELHLSIFGRKPSFSNAYDEDSLQERYNLLEFKGAKNFLLRKLSLKNYHSCELMRLLKERNVSKKTITTLLGEFCHLGYLNDETWVLSQIRYLIGQKFGFKAISNKLRIKRIPDAEIRAAIEAFKENNESLERESIKRLLETRYRNRDLKAKKERDKVIAGLVRKGFSLDDIFHMLSHHCI